MPLCMSAGGCAAFSHFWRHSMATSQIFLRPKEDNMLYAFFQQFNVHSFQDIFFKHLTLSLLLAPKVKADLEKNLSKKHID